MLEIEEGWNIFVSWGDVNKRGKGRLLFRVIEKSPGNTFVLEYLPGEGDGVEGRPSLESFEKGNLIHLCWQGGEWKMYIHRIDDNSMFVLHGVKIMVRPRVGRMRLLLENDDG